jgi:excinuclease UvrABC nuclease subunit
MPIEGLSISMRSELMEVHNMTAEEFERARALEDYISALGMLSEQRRRLHEARDRADCCKARLKALTPEITVLGPLLDE